MINMARKISNASRSDSLSADKLFTSRQKSCDSPGDPQSGFIREGKLAPSTRITMRHESRDIGLSNPRARQLHIRRNVFSSASIIQMVTISLTSSGLLPSLQRNTSSPAGSRVICEEGSGLDQGICGESRVQGFLDLVNKTAPYQTTHKAKAFHLDRCPSGGTRSVFVSETFNPS